MKTANLPRFCGKLSELPQAIRAYHFEQVVAREEAARAAEEEGDNSIGLLCCLGGLLTLWHLLEPLTQTP